MARSADTCYTGSAVGTGFLAVVFEQVLKFTLLVAARTVGLLIVAAETWQIASTAHFLCLHEQCLFEDALFACIETELSAVESVLMAKGALDTLLGVVDFAEVVAVVATFIASGAAFVWSTICSVVVVALLFALASQSAPIRHQVHEVDIVGVLPASSAV